MQIMGLISRFMRDDSGQATVEWSILAVCMALIAISMVAAVAPAIKDMYTKMLDQLGY